MKRMIVVALCLCALGVLACAQEAKPDVKSLEARAVAVVRTINTAQVTYAATYAAQGFVCSLTPMMEEQAGAKPTPEHAGLISKSIYDKDRMYRFEVKCPAGSSKPVKAYTSTATPLVKGARAFCSDQSGVIRTSADGKAETCLAKGEPLL